MRLARKDQEHLRQTLTTLQRMVPLKPLRRGAKLALMRRPAFAHALGMLETLAPLLGGEVAAARNAWVEVAASLGDAPPASAPEGAAAHDPGRAAIQIDGDRPRRRRRRGGRGRGKEQIAETAAPAAVVALAPKLPPVWDDNYFFAALPSVPNLVAAEEDSDSGRYGGGVVPKTEAPADDDPSPRPRRRRRGGRRHRKGGPIIPSSDSSGPTEGDA